MTTEFDRLIPNGCHAVPTDELDLRPDSEVDPELERYRAVTSEKNVWLFWHTGFDGLHPYTKRNVRLWHRRFSKKGWTIRVINRKPGDPLNIDRYVDTHDLDWFPQSFADETLNGRYAKQHTSDLARFPLLVKYGGVYADVGMVQIGDLDRLWHQTIGDSLSGFEVLSYRGDHQCGLNLTNYFLGCGRGNALFARCHKLLLKLWEGRTDTSGLHAHPLVKGVPAQGGGFEIKEEGKPIIGKEEAGKLLTDYIIQGQVMSMVMGLVDKEDSWNGPEYVQKHVFGIDFINGSQLIYELTKWNGQAQYELMSRFLPVGDAAESSDQRHSREVVQMMLQRSWAMKLAHGMILAVYGETLGSLWRSHEGSDVAEGTYAALLRYGTLYWTQNEVPKKVEYPIAEPWKRGRLLEP